MTLNTKAGLLIELILLALAVPAVASPDETAPVNLLGSAFTRGAPADAADEYAWKAREAVTPKPVIPATAAPALNANQRLARSISLAARESLFSAGIKSSESAVIECVDGDYPGGGMGLLSQPYLAASARTDHCRR